MPRMAAAHFGIEQREKSHCGRRMNLLSRLGNRPLGQCGPRGGPGGIGAKPGRRHFMRLLKRCALITMALITLCQSAGAQDYPSRPVTIVVPFAPGGSTDLLSRMVGQKLEQRWGKTFVIENKPGAASLVAASAVAKANPDGYTLMMAPSATMSTNVTLYKNLPYDPVAELIPLAVIAQTPFVLVVNTSLPVHSVQEFIKWAKEQGGQLSYATVGPGQPHHLFAELFKSMTGVEMSPVRSEE